MLLINNELPGYVSNNLHCVCVEWKGLEHFILQSCISKHQSLNPNTSQSLPHLSLWVKHQQKCKFIYFWLTLYRSSHTSVSTFLFPLETTNPSCCQRHCLAQPVSVWLRSSRNLLAQRPSLHTEAYAAPLLALWWPGFAGSLCPPVTVYLDS